MKPFPMIVAASFLLPILTANAQTSSGTAAANPAKKKPAAAKPAAASQRPASAPLPQRPVVVAPPAPPVPPAAPPSAVSSGPESAQTPEAISQRQRENVERLHGTTLNLIRALVQEGVLSKEKALEMLPAADRALLDDIVPAKKTTTTTEPAAAEPGAESGESGTTATPGRRKRGQTVRVPYIPETVKNEIRDQVREDVVAQAKAERWAEPSALPEWLDRITWEGDIRLRYQGDYFQPTNTPALVYNAITGSELDNTTTDDARFRYRARIGMLARITESWSAGFRLATGNTTDPVSTNQTLGNYFNRSGLTLDRAYLRWERGDRWSATGGRMPNPYFHTDIMWDEDLTFEGASGTVRPALAEDLRAFVTAGGFIVQHQSPTSVTPEPKTKYLLGVQAGGDWDWSPQGKLRFGVALYDYQNIHGIRNQTLNSQATDWTQPAFRQKGNTVFNIDNDGNPATNKFALASKFQLINVTANLDINHFEPFNIRLIGDFAKNLAFDQAEIRQRTGLNIVPKTIAWRTGVLVGKTEIRSRNDWQFFVDYRYLGADSVLDAFTDSDFNLGGTNAKGYTVGGQYGIDRNVWARARWLSSDQIQGPPLSIDVLQLDLNARF